MSQNPIKNKASLIVCGLLMAGAAANNLRNTVAYSDPFCNTFSADGLCCLKCSFHYFMDCDGKCVAVSDWCKTWNKKTGECTSCFEGYGKPVNGVCSNIPVGGENDGNGKHCDDHVVGGPNHRDCDDNHKVGNPDHDECDDDHKVGNPDHDECDDDHKVGNPDHDDCDDDHKVGNPDHDDCDNDHVAEAP